MRMNRSIAVNPLRLVLGIAALLTAGLLSGVAAVAADTAANQLQSIDVQTLSDKQVQLTLHMSGPAPEPLSFTIDKPARISLDLVNTSLALPSRRIDVRAGGIDTLLAAEANGRSRIVLNLDTLQPYTTRIDGNDLIVTVGTGTVVASSQPAQAATAAGGRSIRSIDFRRGEGNVGRLVVRLSDPRTPINLQQQGSQIFVSFGGTDLPKTLQRRYDTMDFGTPITGFEAARQGADTRIVLDGSGDFEQLAYQSDDQYVVEVQPRRPAATAVTDDKVEYRGEKLSLNFQDIETRAVLQLLADASGQNIVVSDTVNGSVTLRLQSVPWDQALDIVMRTKGLDKRQQGNVIIIAPAEELATREKAELSAKKDIRELVPIRSEYMQINYAKAADIAALLKGGGASGAGGAGGGNSILSSRGSVGVDARTNTLLVTDTVEK